MVGVRKLRVLLAFVLLIAVLVICIAPFVDLEVIQGTQKIQNSLGECHVVLVVGRLDYTKGIPEKLRAFRSLLKNCPELRGEITLIQIVVPSREDIPRYQELKRQVELLVSEINGQFSEPGWTPVHNSPSDRACVRVFCLTSVRL
jgi:trehalose-6-phosphate synthase